MNYKKCAALGVLVVMLLGLTSCIGNFYENAGSINGTPFSSGLYLMAQHSAYTEAKNKEGIDAEKDLFKQSIDGVKMNDWIKTRTDELLRRYTAVRTLARQRDITLDSTGQENLKQMSQYWTYLEPDYTANGISISTFERYLTTDELNRQLFQSLYAKDGELAVPDDELKKEYGEKFAHLSAYSIPLNSSDENVDVEDEVLALVEKLPAKLKAGTSMEDMVKNELAAIYKITGRSFDATTSVDSIYSNYIEYEPEDFETYSEEFLSSLKKQKIGDFGFYNMGNTAIIYEVVPTFSDEAEFEAERENIITKLKKEAYDEYLKEIYSQYQVEYLPFVRNYFSPSSIKQT